MGIGLEITDGGVVQVGGLFLFTGLILFLKASAAFCIWPKSYRHFARFSQAGDKSFFLLTAAS